MIESNQERRRKTKLEASRTQLCSRLAGQAFLVASGRGDGKEEGPCKSCRSMQSEGRI